MLGNSQSCGRIVFALKSPSVSVGTATNAPERRAGSGRSGDTSDPLAIPL
jgi:hypothetical protein